MNPSIVTLDTLKVQIPNISDYIEEIDLSLFKETKSTFQGNTQSTSILKEPDTIGLSQFAIFENSGSAILEVSAKILLDDYSKGISLETLDRFSSSIKSKGITLSPNWVNNAYVLKCDSTKNIHPTNLKQSLHDLNLLGLNTSFALTSYPGSIIFQARAKTDKGRMIFYDKHRELDRKPNRNFIKAINPKTLNSFIGVLRCERNLRSLKDIRESFSIAKKMDMTIGFLDVLSSKENPNLKLFNKITQIQLPLFSVDPNYSNIKSWHQIEKLYGMDRIIQDCNYDLNVIMIAVKDYVSGNLSAYRKQYRERIAVLQATQEKKSLTNSLNEIMEQLAV